MSNYTLKYLLQLARRGGPDLPFDGTEVVHIAAGADGKDYHCMLIDLLGLGGYPTWDSETTYNIGDRVTYGLRLWETLVDGNLGNVPTEGANWTEVSPGALTLRVVIIIPAASVRACGGTPYTIKAAPGAGRFISGNKLTVSKLAGAVAYDFPDDVDVVIKPVGGGDMFHISAADINVVGTALFNPPRQNTKEVENAAYVLTTSDGSNATVGDSDLRVTFQFDDDLI